MSGFWPAVQSVLVHGLPNTLIMSAAAMAIALLGGFILGVARSLRNRYIDAVVIGYVELLRGIPVLVLMFFVFFGLPQLGMHFSEMPSAIIALGLWAAANGAEIVRGAIFSIPSGQLEAGKALGIGWFTLMGQIVLPQALRRMVPPFMSLFTAVVETSSLAALIPVRDILESVRLKTEVEPSLWFPLLVAILFLYFFINYPISLASQRLEKRLA
jgi:His/Glu/Gln/Arg/opine family amino acid ABC transporter permease subunit